ncbi:MAG: hypothetical protein R6W73_01720 [Candidatus Saliniplasma sp.]
MEGIKISDQNLFAEEDIESAKAKIRSIVHAEGGVQLKGVQNSLEGNSTLNSYEIDFYPQEKGTSIRVKYGLTTLGLILGVILLFVGVVVGAIILILWYIKMDEVKSAMDKAFPEYVPPAPRGQYSQYKGPSKGPQQSYGNSNEDSDIPPPPKD